MIHKTRLGIPPGRAACILILFASPISWTPQMIARSQPSMQPPKPFQIWFCSERPGKPPLKKLFFNVTLRNLSDHPRWFLLPHSLYSQPSPPEGGGFVDVVEVRAVKAPGNVKIATFMGNVRLQPESAGGFQALLLPAKAVINLRNVQIELWGETAPRVPINLVMADQLMVAGKPAGEWLGRDLVTDTTADVEDDTQNVILAKGSAEEQLPVQIHGSEEFLVADALSARCNPATPPVSFLNKILSYSVPLDSCPALHLRLDLALLGGEVCASLSSLAVSSWRSFSHL